MRKLVAAVVTVVVAAAVAVPALAAPTCFTRDELRALSAVAIGPMFKAATEQCRSFPGSTPLLTQGAPGIATRFEAARRAAVPVLAPKLMAMMNLRNVPAEAAVDAVAPMLTLGLQSAFGKLDESSCRSADAIAGPLLSLGDAQLVSMLGEILLLTAGREKGGTLALCGT